MNILTIGEMLSILYPYKLVPLLEVVVEWQGHHGGCTSYAGAGFGCDPIWFHTKKKGKKRGKDSPLFLHCSALWVQKLTN